MFRGTTFTSLLRFFDSAIVAVKHCASDSCCDTWFRDRCFGSLSARCCMENRLVTGFDCSVWLGNFPVSVSGRLISVPRLSFGVVTSCFMTVLPLFHVMTRASSLSCPKNDVSSQVPTQHLHSRLHVKVLKMGHVPLLMLTILPSLVLQSLLNIGGLRAMVSGAGNTLIMHSVVLLWHMVIRRVSVYCDLEEEGTSSISVFTSGAGLIPGSGVPALCCRCAVRPCCPYV